MKKGIRVVFITIILIIITHILFLLIKLFIKDDLLNQYIYKACHIIPLHVMFWCGALSLLSYFTVVIILFKYHERKIDKKSKVFNSACMLWFVIPVFTKRYKNIPYLSLFFAIFWAGLIYYVGTILSYFILFIFNINFSHPTISNPLTFLSGPGIIISFIILVFSLWTFINTVIAKAKNNLPIDTLNDLTYYLDGSLDNSSLFGRRSEWDRFKNSNIFYYVFDTSISIRHISDENNYISYLHFLRELRSKYIVNFKAIVYDFKDLLKTYKTQYSILLPDSPEKKSIEANDFTLFYLNSNHLPHDKHPHIHKENSITYKSFNINELIDKKDAFFGTDLIEFNESAIKDINSVLDKNALTSDKIKNFYSTVKESDNFVFYTSEIGLTRFIVSNLFVIQFIASSNKSGKVPAGYISEDVILIERYKKAFEDYLYGEKIIKNPT